MAGEVVTTGTRAADAARADTRQGTNPSSQDAEQAEAAVGADVPEPRVLNGTPDPKTAPPPARDTGIGTTRAQRARVTAAQSQPADAAVPGVGVRRRLARLGAQRGANINPVLEPLIKTVRGTHPKADVRLIERAYESAAHWHRDQKRRSGDPYITHPLAVATILAELGMNTETICAALLHDTVEDTPYTLTELRSDFGEDIATLVDGVTKLDKVKYGESAEAETVRKMVVAMARDIRVLVIKLADRLHNMRTLRYLAREKQERKSRETLEIFAPLAHRLGMNTVKWELEDLAFATLYPKRFDEIVRLVSNRAPRREAFLQEVIQDVSADLREAKINQKVTGRPKHYYSIYQKMIARDVGFDDIYDLVGIRVLVDSVKDCYAALGIIHARWNPVPGRFKDYIAMPKFNMYQSLHTTVIGPGGKSVELQIRTWDMHRRAEYGVAAHWKYKEETVFGRAKDAKDAKDDSKEMTWLRQLVDWQRETEDPAEFLESLRFDLAAGEVYVFTPRGEVVALPQGATPVDFAYAIHTEVGHRTVGARVNGRLVALESALDNGDTVEIFTSKTPDACRAGTGSSSCRARGPGTRSGSGSPRSAGKPRSTRARTRSPRRCASRACRWPGSPPPTACSPWLVTCTTSTSPRCTRPSARAGSAPSPWSRNWSSRSAVSMARRRTWPRPRCRPRRRSPGRPGTRASRSPARRTCGCGCPGAARRCRATRSSASSPTATACPCTGSTA